MNQNKLNFYLDIVTAVVGLALAFTGFLLFFVLPSGSGGRSGGEALALWGWTRHDFGDVHLYLAFVFVLLVLVHVWLHWTWVCTTVCRLSETSKPEARQRLAYGIGAFVVFALLLVGGLWLANTQVKTTYGSRRGASAGNALHLGDGNMGLGRAGRGMGRRALNTEDPKATADKNRFAGPMRFQQEKTPSESQIGRGRARNVQIGNPDHVQEDFLNEREGRRGGNHPIHGQMTLLEAARLGDINAEQLKKQLGLPENVDVNERLGRLKRDHGLDLYALREMVGQ